MQQSRLFLIDAHAVCYRAFYAIKGLLTSRGQATNAVFGFVNTLKKIQKNYRPDYWAVCFDTPERTHREQQYARYKIQRPVMPDGLISQMPYIKEIVRAYNMCLFEAPGYEADDLIATIIRQVRSRVPQIVIASDDKDIYQLADAQVSVYHSRKDRILSYQDIKELLGIEPADIPDYIGLAGDATDNIPGVKGIGPVFAKKLIARYGSLEKIYDRLSDVDTVRVRDCLQEQKKEAFLSKELAVLDAKAPLELDLDKMKAVPPDQSKLLDIFNKLEFRRLAEELAGQVQQSFEVTVRDLKKTSDMEALFARSRAHGSFAFMTEENNGSRDLLLTTQDEILYRLPWSAVMQVEQLFKDPGIVIVTHDVKQELKRFHQAGLHVRGPLFDVMLAAYLLAPARSTFDPGSLAWDYLNIPIPPEQRCRQGLVAVQRMYPLLRKDLQDKGLNDLFEEIEIPLTRVLARMETEGVSLDVNFLKELSRHCDAKIQGLVAELYALAGQEFNLNSPKQLSEILFDKLKLPVIKKTKTGFSTDEGVLRQLASQHKLPAMILDYRQLAKLKSTYIDALPKLADPRTGKIHAAFDQTGTETGRLSSYDPNLQNIPIRTDIGRQIRKAFIPSEKGHRIVSADYSQIELRILAHLSADENLIRAFRQGQDIHQYTAALIYEVPEDDVTADMRATAKRVNFGIIYGMSSFGLAKDLQISLPEAEEFIAKYFLRYPRVKDFMDACVRQCEEQGYVLTLLKRRRYIPEITSPNLALRQFAQRQAINTPVQGSAADLIKLAMIRIHEALDQQHLISKMLITVHDELVFDVPREEMDGLVRLVREHMENAFSLTVPIRVTIRQGENWLEMTEVPSGMATDSQQPKI